MASANSVGRPPKFQSLEELETLINDYFETEEGKNTPTVTGLALALDTTRKTLLDYCELDNEFSYTIKKAKARVERKMEQHLYGNNVTGLIFNLKNNFGWRDRTETDITTGDQPLSGLQVPQEKVAEFSAWLAENSKHQG
jgi:hypothetical protein